jgi:DNA-binding PadR family transcriptional regulator
MPAAARTTDGPGGTTDSLTNSAAAVLGMIALGARSGYEIRRAAELSLRFFWALGPPQIYAECGRLEEAGLITGRDDHRGRRPRRTYEPTARGHAVLRQWASSRQPAALELRDVLLLQLFFADFSDPADVTALLERMRERSVDALATFDEQIMPAAVRTEQRGLRQPKVVAEFGAALHRFIVDWCDERLGDA